MSVQHATAKRDTGSNLNEVGDDPELFCTRPTVPPHKHPVETGRYLLATNSIIQLSTVLQECLTSQVPGVLVYGDPRLGKTQGLRFVTDWLSRQPGQPFPVFTIDCPYMKTANEGRLYGAMLEGAGHLLSLNGKPEMKRRRLLTLWQDAARQLGSPRILLLMDEAQNLKEQDYTWLIGISNALDHDGISLTTVLVGQPELAHRREAFQEMGQNQIIERFMNNQIRFEGIKGKRDLATCFQGYDELSEYPEGSRWSFSRYYFPDSFAYGYRLSNGVDDYLEAYGQVHESSFHTGRSEISMYHFTRSVNYCLTHFGADGDGVSQLTVAHWRKGIASSYSMIDDWSKRHSSSDRNIQKGSAS